MIANFLCHNIKSNLISKPTTIDLLIFFEINIIKLYHKMTKLVENNNIRNFCYFFIFLILIFCKALFVLAKEVHYKIIHLFISNLRYDYIFLSYCPYYLMVIIYE